MIKGKNVHNSALLLLAVIIAAVLMVSCGKQQAEEQRVEVTPDQVKLLQHDVNYSQCWKHQGVLGYTGVETLLLIRNDSDEAIDRCAFTYSTDQDGEVSNLDDPGKPFVARGYVAPHQIGYMVSRLYIPDNTDHDQGTITPVSVQACSARDEETLPRISGVWWYDRAYQENQYGKGEELFSVNEWNVDFDLTNSGTEPFVRDKIILLAAPDLGQMDQDKGAEVFGKWACGTLKNDIAPGETAAVRAALDNPQFDIGLEKLSQSDLNLYVIDTDGTEWTRMDHEPEVTMGAKRIVSKAKELAWPFGTEESVYTYQGGSPTEAYREAIASAYPDKDDWGKQPRSGASCDVFVGTVVRSAGYDPEFPRGLGEVEEHVDSHPQYWKKYTSINPDGGLKPGDVIDQRWKVDGESKGHILIYIGNGRVANAHYGNGGKYGVIELAKDQIRTNTDNLQVGRRYLFRPVK